MISIGFDTGKHCGYAVLRIERRPRHILSGMLPEGDPAARAAAIRQLLAEVRPELVGIEMPGGVFASQGIGAALARAAQLREADRLVGRLEAEAEHARAEIFIFTAAEWGLELLGDRQPGDPAIAAYVLRTVRDWPLVSNAHRRDAAGVALWAATRAGAWRPR